MNINRTLMAIAAIMLMMVFAVSCNKSDEPNNGGDNSIVDNSGNLDGHDYVDLGLPSGTMWATCNVGADKPEDYGDYFAWGETQPKDVYSWDTYLYCNGIDIDTINYYTVLPFLTKYCNDPSCGYNGFTDELTSLVSEDDAATVNWGSVWRMPTKFEWDELLQNTRSEWIVQSGVKGRLFTSSNGNCVFLPATGMFYNDTTVFRDGLYWSSSLLMQASVDAWYCHFSTGDSISVLSRGRYNGMPVRPVHSMN